MRSLLLSCIIFPAPGRILHALAVLNILSTISHNVILSLSYKQISCSLISRNSKQNHMSLKKERERLAKGHIFSHNDRLL